MIDFTLRRGRCRLRALRQEKENQRRDQIQEIDGHFADRRRFLITENTFQQGAEQRMGRQGAAEIEGDVLEVVPQAGFVEGTDRPGRPGRRRRTE